jgi:hypothetical protein
MRISLKRVGGVATIITAAGSAIVLSAASITPRTGTNPAPATVTVYASGLNDPRGLTFGPDGRLYVAEAGSGGASISTVGDCDQVTAIGPILGGNTARIVAVDPNGSVTPVVQGMPSSEAIPEVGGDKLGISAVGFLGNHLYGLLPGAGCSHGHLLDHNAIFAVTASGPRTVADLSEWILANPGAKGAEVPRSPDYEPDGTWYSMLFDRGRFLALEPNHGLLVSVHPVTGAVTLERELYTEFGDHTYASMAVDRGDVYIGTLGQIVFTANGPDLNASFDAGIYRIGSNGAAAQVASGLKAVLGVAFDKRHRMYALQSPIFVPGTGSLVRVDPDGTIVPIVPGLNFPSGVILGPDGAFYVSACGYHCAPGAGQILRIEVQ